MKPIRVNSSVSVPDKGKTSTKLAKSRKSHCAEAQGGMGKKTLTAQGSHGIETPRPKKRSQYF